MNEEKPVFCKCGRLATLTLSSGAKSVSICDDCFDAMAKRARQEIRDTRRGRQMSHGQGKRRKR